MKRVMTLVSCSHADSMGRVIVIRLSVVIAVIDARLVIKHINSQTTQNVKVCMIYCLARQP